MASHGKTDMVVDTELLAQTREVRDHRTAFDYKEQNHGSCAVGIAFTVAGIPLAVSNPMPAQRFEGHEREHAAALKAFRERMGVEDGVCGEPRT